MAYFLVKFENSVYASGELYTDVIAKGKRAFQKMLANKTVIGKLLLDQVLYPVTPEQREICEAHNPIFQDFDDVIRHFNIVSKETLCQIRKKISEAFYNALVITVDSVVPVECFKYKYTTFFKVTDWNYENKYKYHALPKMAAVKLCGFLYVALNAVDVRVETPIIATLKS